MNPGRIAAVLYDAVAWFFILSFVVFPVLKARWNKREREDAAKTEATLKRLGFDRSNTHIWDA